MRGLGAECAPKVFLSLTAIDEGRTFDRARELFQEFARVVQASPSRDRIEDQIARVLPAIASGEIATCFDLAEFVCDFGQLHRIAVVFRDRQRAAKETLGLDAHDWRVETQAAEFDEVARVA